MREFTVFAPAKLNLYLDVLGKRPDGYHNIETLFERIDLKDEIIVKEKGKSIKVTVEPPLCPAGKDNIVYKALDALFREANVDLGLEILIKKRIPVYSGLGGGSTDAGSVLLAINKEFDLGVSFERLLSIAVGIGKDVPFFMLGVPFAIGRQTGEILEPIETECSFAHVILKPQVSISTLEMYKKLNGLSKGPKKFAIEKIVSAVKEKDLTLVRENFYNIFEEFLAKNELYIEKAKTLLKKAGGGPGFLSGTGSAVFCIVKDIEEAKEIADRIPKKKDIEVFVTKTL